MEVVGFLLLQLWKATKQKTNKINLLSEQELVDCVRGGKDTCTQGGEMYDGEEYGNNWYGVRSRLSISRFIWQCMQRKRKKYLHKYSGYTNITSGDEDALKSATFEQPIISVGIDASSIWFQLTLVVCSMIKAAKQKAADLDHGVAVVGYGTSKAKISGW